MIIDIDDKIIKRYKKACIKNGYDYPTNKKEWKEIIEQIIEDSIIEDFGDEY